MRVVGGLQDFKFHDMCKDIKLNHLCFADDLIIFCKANEASIMRVMEALDYFNVVLGLIVNEAKSQIFIAGVNADTKEALMAKAGFKEGTLPMKYLGVSLAPRKWNKRDYRVIINKITSRLTHWTSRLLSYAGSLRLINSVLFSLQVYWAGIFILPKAVLENINQICRDFLWGGVNLDKKLAPVAWEHICRPKIEEASISRTVSIGT